jgi:FtsP/CotA-like multicopper oxidase with cupredoxin domain/plastocyanin
MNRDDRSVLGWGAFGVAVAALIVAIFGVYKMSEDESASAGTTTPEAAATVVDVILTEFAISPANIVVAPGPVTLRVVNNGSMAHNFALPDLDLRTAMLNAGESETLEFDAVEGTYKTVCEVPGHEGSGMVGTLTVSAGAAGGTGESAAGGADGLHGFASWQEMDAAMEARAKAFPAKTEGVGGQVLEPKILPDGTKEFEITASEFDWEVEPGKIVKAKGYNNQVPGPEIRVEVGDKVRMIVHNELPVSTDVHFHGIRVPNTMDGVDPYTQAPITPGSTFVYEFEALEPAVGIYHPHHDAQVQIPDGMFGAFMIGTMPIPDAMIAKGFTEVDQEITMVLNDAGAIGLSLNGKSFPATQPYSMRVGEVMMVHYQNEGLQGHPMHLHQPVGWIVAKDGVPLDVPVPGDTIWVSPGERYTVLYKAVDPGVWAWHCHILTHAEGPDGIFGMTTALVVTP